MLYIFSTAFIYNLKKIQLPLEVLSEILKEVVLEDGDSAYLTLSLVCRLFRDVVTNDVFRKKANFAWMDSKICFVLRC